MGIGPSQGQQFIEINAQIILGIGSEELPHQGRVEVIEARPYRSVGGKYIARPGNGQCFPKGGSRFPHKITGALQDQKYGMAFVHMKDFRDYMEGLEQATPTDSQHDFLLYTKVGPALASGTFYFPMDRI